MTNISTLGQTLEQISRLKSTQVQLSDINKQIATGRRADTFAGFGEDAILGQRLRANISEIDSYLRNIALLNPRIEIMQGGIEEIQAQADVVLGALGFQIQEGTPDMDTLNSFGRDGLDVIQDLLNSDINGRFLFAGDDVTTPPYENPAILQSQVSSLVTDFLDGSITPDQFMTQLNGLSDTELGFSANVQAAGGQFSRIDSGVEIDYTTKANAQAFKDTIGALAALENLSFPQEGVDVATEDDYFQLINALQNKLSTGIDGIQQEFNGLERNRVTLDRTRQGLEADLSIFKTQLEDLEAVDPAEAIVTFQSLQTQLETSYRVTAIIADTSLVNFL